MRTQSLYIFSVVLILAGSGAIAGCAAESSDQTAETIAESTEISAETGTAETVAQAADAIGGDRLSAASVGLTDDQLQLLSALEIPIVLPAAIPEGFSILDVNAGISGDGPGGGPRYTVTYSSPSGCFVVESSTGGFGGPVPPNQQPIAVPIFEAIESQVLPPDYQYSLFWSEGEMPDSPYPEPIIFSDWLEGEATFYRVTSGYNGSDYGFCSPMRRITPAQAIEITESLNYVETVE